MNEKLIGGYASLRTRAVKQGTNPHTDALVRPVRGTSLAALNHIQKTRWRINVPVMQVVREAQEASLDIGGLPATADVPLPQQLSPEVYEAMSQEERVKARRQREEIHARNAALKGTRAHVFRRLALAEDLARFPALWFPHSCDFRGRLYPVPQDLHPQGDSLTKGLLEFAEPVALGASGQWWLYVVLANAMGHDKLPLQHRADWTENNLTTILAAARDPMAFVDFWAHSDVDSPWEALGLILEVAKLAQWIGLGNRADEFLSTAPVRLDATCSGIQHLSALMRDTVSARCVNVQPTGNREDIYSDVAKVVLQRIALDAAGGNPVAVRWLGKVTRSTVKRAVMTTPYGVTERGIADQLVYDGHCSHFPREERGIASMYLKDQIVGALDANIGAPRRAMQYMQQVALHLAEDDIPLQWDTPAGFTVRQAYFETDDQKVVTLAGTTRLRVENPAAGLVKRKQAAAAAPNVVHSLDAAHLCLTAVALRDDGIRDLAFVHDSFGAHAGNADQLSLRLREQFVGMYQRPVLADWRESVAAYSGRDDLPPLPELGDLDVSAALGSEFFFS